MRVTIKSIFCLLLAAVVFTVVAVPCLAITDKGSITVTLEDKNKNRINGETVHVCRIAELDGTGYHPAKGFEDSGISVSGIVSNPDQAAAMTVADYVMNKGIPAMSVATENGKATFSDLELGIWLVFSDDDGKYKFNPYIVFLPYESGGKLSYEISSAPKAEDNRSDEINVYVVKKWDDKNNAEKKRPDFVTVDLMNGESVVGTVELSEANGWAHTFSGVPKDGDYSVRERAVTDYKANYSGDKTNGFIVTNTYSGGNLVQTGQLWWPVAPLFIAGIGFILFGIVSLPIKNRRKKES